MFSFLKTFLFYGLILKPLYFSSVRSCNQTDLFLQNEEWLHADVKVIDTLYDTLVTPEVQRKSKIL